jgi:hypothetical protein
MRAFAKDLFSLSLWRQFLTIFYPPLIIFALYIAFYHALHTSLHIPWIDIPRHFLAGLTLAYSFFLALKTLQENGKISRLDRIIELVLVFTAVATTAVFWELFEFAMYKLVMRDLDLRLTNTMQDLVMGILGASTMIGYKILKDTKHIFQKE